jgi:NTP pyrophosphatase (non-canonical NTP hydrolase)
MRPDKKGLWLFKTSHDELRAINLDENLRTPLHDSIEQFESIFEGFEWLGPAHPPTTRESVSWFAEQMEAKLIENDRKYGWGELTDEYLFKRLNEEIFELGLALRIGENVEREAADVANFCMMIADNWRNQDNETE